MIWKPVIFLFCFCCLGRNGAHSYSPFLYPLNGSVSGRLYFPLEDPQGRGQLGFCMAPLWQGVPGGYFLLTARGNLGKGIGEFQTALSHYSAGAYLENGLSVAFIRSFSKALRAYVEPAYRCRAIERYGGAGSFSFRGGLLCRFSSWELASVYTWEQGAGREKPVNQGFLTLNYKVAAKYSAGAWLCHHSVFGARGGVQAAYKPDESGRIGLSVSAGGLLFSYARVTGRFCLDLSFGYQRFLGLQSWMGTTYAR